MSIYPSESSFFKRAPTRNSSLRFLFKLSNLLGIWPFDTNCGSPLHIRIYSATAVWAVVPLGMILTVYALNFIHLTTKNSLTFPLLFMTQETLQSLLWVVQFLCFSIYRDRFKRMLQSVEDWSTSNKLRFSVCWTTAGLIFLPLYHVALIFFDGKLDFQGALLLYLVFKSLKEFGIHLVLVQFCTFLEIIAQQLDYVTRSLDKSSALESLTVKHHQLVKTASSLNDLYSWQLLIICTLNFINFVSWLFYAMQDVLLDKDVHLWPFQLSYCAWQLLNVFFIAGSCEKLVEKAEGFNSELFRIMRSSSTLCNNSNLNLYVTIKQNVNFTASGFFSLGYPLVTSIISSATTYLVILVQFSTPSV